MDAGLEIRAQPALGEVGTADDRLRLVPRLEVEDLGMEAARAVLRDISVGNINEAIDQRGLGCREVDTKKHGLELFSMGKKRMGNFRDRSAARRLGKECVIK